MTESYEGNGEYNYNDEETDFKRKRERDHDTNGTNGEALTDHQDENEDGNGEDVPIGNQKANDYIRDCLMEKNRIEKDYPIAARLLGSEIEAVQKTGRIPSRDAKYADIYKEKLLRLSQKIRVPVREHPKFNFVGKILGPKGNSLKRLQEDTLCKMTVLGRNSMRDRAKEDELRASMDPKYAHLNDDLHVEISTIAPPAEAYARMAYALAELRKYLTPDSNDEIRQEQLRELMEHPPPELEGKIPQYKKVAHVSQKYRSPLPSHSSVTPSRTAIPQKQKVYSILEKARTAIDESYRRIPHHNDYHSYQEPSYDAYSYSYESYKYEPSDYSRLDYYSQSPSYGVKPPSSSETRPSGWKPPSSVVPSYSSSRRHDDHMVVSSAHAPTSTSKHAYSSRDARYKAAPYARVGK